MTTLSHNKNNNKKKKKKKYKRRSAETPSHFGELDKHGVAIKALSIEILDSIFSIFFVVKVLLRKKKKKKKLRKENKKKKRQKKKKKTNHKSISSSPTTLQINITDPSILRKLVINIIFNGPVRKVTNIHPGPHLVFSFLFRNRDKLTTRKTRKKETFHYSKNPLIIIKGIHIDLFNQNIDEELIKGFLVIMIFGFL